MFDNTTFVLDAHYMAVPKGVSREKLAVLVDLMVYMAAAGAAGLCL